MTRLESPVYPKELNRRTHPEHPELSGRFRNGANMMKVSLKKGIFTVGVDDGPHYGRKGRTGLYFIFCRGQFLEKVVRSSVEIDGFDSTDVIIDVLKRYTDRYSLVLTHGITFGGFNIADINKISETLGKPVIAVTENIPGDDFFSALSNLSGSEKRRRIAYEAGKMYTVKLRRSIHPLYFYCKGITPEKAGKILGLLCIRSRLPEPLNLAHKIASMTEVDGSVFRM